MSVEVTTIADMKIYEAQFASGRTEIIQQNFDAFNQASNGAIVFRSSVLPANYEYNSFFKANGSLVTRQDITSIAARDSTQITQDENISVKVHRMHLSGLTPKAAKMAGISFDEMLFSLGQQVAAEMSADFLNTGLLAARAALSQNAAVTKDITAATVKTISHGALLSTLAKFGDKTDRIAAWVMHSTQFFDLGLQAIDDDITNVADGIVRRIDVPGLGRPILVTDSPSLIVAGDTPDSYYVLGLAKGGIDINESEGMEDLVDKVSQLEQIKVNVQSEWAYNVGVKGYKWDVGNGAANPDASTIGTTTNWDKTASSDKDVAGVVLKCQALADQ